MPELPELTAYLEALAPRMVGEPLERVRLFSPFLLRSVQPPLDAAVGRRVEGLRRLGKRLVFALEGDLFLAIHLMLTGRLRWAAAGAKPPGRIGLASFDFPHGTLQLTEASKKKRASLHLVAGGAALSHLDPGGIEPLTSTPDELRAALSRENRTLKRALTDQRLVAGIGNAYSDEILWAAHLSPFARTGDLREADWARLLAAIHDTLTLWSQRLCAEAADRFPERVSALRPDRAVHGRFRQPCPRCGGPIQRIVYAENEANYCPACQTGGRLLADRALSKLLGADWPRTVEELEERKRSG